MPEAPPLSFPNFCFLPTSLLLATGMSLLGGASFFCPFVPKTVILTDSATAHPDAVHLARLFPVFIFDIVNEATMNIFMHSAFPMLGIHS